MPERIVVGVDGGGTKTEAVAIDEAGRVVGRGIAGPGNWELIGMGGLLAAASHALDLALDEAKVHRADVAASAFALAGVDWPSDEARLRPGLAQLGLGGELVLVNDAFAAMRAGCDEPFGAVSNAGTGTVTAARNRAGERPARSRCSATASAAARATSSTWRCTRSHAPTTARPRRRC